MPKSRLDSLLEEQERLSRKQHVTQKDEKRRSELQRLVADERKKIAAEKEAAGKAASANSAARVTPRASSQGRPTARDDPRASGMYGIAPKRVADGQTNPYGVSNAVKERRDLIRESIGLAPLVQAGFFEAIEQEDAEGNLITTGFRIADRFAGTVDPNEKTRFGQGRDPYRFGPQGQPQAQRTGSFTKGRGLSLLTGMSVRDVYEFYASLEPDELIVFQRELADAGYYEGGQGSSKPQFGFQDQATTAALSRFMLDWSSQPDKSFKDLMTARKTEYNSRISEKIRESAGIVSLPDQISNITFTDAATLGNAVDAVALDLFGQTIDPNRRSDLVARLQAQEREFKTAGVTRDFNTTNANAQAKAGNSDLDQFMTALIGQESGGNAEAVNTMSGAMGLGQIMPDNWGPWSREAGVDSADFSEANQRRVIKYKLAKYYEQFGNWRDVAIAWYGGGGAPEMIRSGAWSATREQEGGYPSFNSYADSIMSKMGAQTTSQLVNTPKLTVNATEDLPDARDRIASELKAADPQRYFGTQFYRQANNFFSLLRGPV